MNYNDFSEKFLAIYDHYVSIIIFHSHEFESDHEMIADVLESFSTLDPELLVSILGAYVGAFNFNVVSRMYISPPPDHRLIELPNYWLLLLNQYKVVIEDERTNTFSILKGKIAAYLSEEWLPCYTSIRG